MPTPPSTDNYQVGGVTIIVGGIDLGNIVTFAPDPSNIETLDHFSARSGTRKLDKQVIVQKTMRFRVGLDEHAPELYRLYFMGGGAGSAVTPLLNPLAERNIVITYLNEAGNLWTYSHTKCVVKPDGAMDFGEFNDWVGYGLAIETLEDSAVPTAPFGTITFA